MKNFIKAAGYIAMLLAAYFVFQFLFTYLSYFVITLGMVLAGDAPLGALRNAGAASMPGSLSVWGLAMGLMLSTLAMLVFIHCVKGYRLRWSILRSMSGESLFVSTMLVFSSLIAANIFVQWFELEDNLAGQFDGLTHNVAGAITVSLLAPLLEEVLFRGAIQGYLMRRCKPWVAILCAASIFGVVHLNPVQTVYAVIIGVVFGWIYYRTGSLLSVIVGHVLNNSMATAALLLYGNEDELSFVGEAAPQGAEMVAEVFVFVVFALLSLYFALRLNRIQPPVPSPWKDVSGAVE